MTNASPTPSGKIPLRFIKNNGLKMSSFIKQIKIKELFGKKDIEWNLGDVNILVGKNGSGKTTILKSLMDLLKERESIQLSSSSEFEVTFNDNTKTKHKLTKLDLSKKEMLSLVKLLQISKTGDDAIKGNKKKITELMSSLNKTDPKSEIESISFSEIKIPKKSIINNLSIDLISTVNMNASSINEINRINGDKTTLLDLEIDIEKTKFFQKKEEDSELFKNRSTKLISALNFFYNDCKKSARILGNNIVVRDDETSQLLRTNMLSSGERQLLYILLKAINISGNNNILLMDEPEISLHLAWQKDLIEKIKEINENCQLIIVTHSPSIMMNGWLDNYVEIESIQKDTL